MMKINFNRLCISLSCLMWINTNVLAKSIDPTSFYTNFQDIKLIDQNGVPFDTNTLDTKITIFNFIYTQCVSICSTQTSDILKIYQHLSPDIKKDFRFVSISLDPIKDNPKKLKKYASQLKADVEGWHFISTNFNDLNRLSTKISLFKEDHGTTVYDTLKPSKQQAFKLEEHKTGLWLIDANGHVRQRYVGNPIEMNRILNEISILHNIQFNHKESSIK